MLAARPEFLGYKGYNYKVQRHFWLVSLTSERLPAVQFNHKLLRSHLQRVIEIKRARGTYTNNECLQGAGRPFDTKRGELLTQQHLGNRFVVHSFSRRSS